MAKEEMKIGEVSKPRFEFRSFGQCFCEAHKRMAHLPQKRHQQHQDSRRQNGHQDFRSIRRWT